MTAEALHQWYLAHRDENAALAVQIRDARRERTAEDNRIAQLMRRK